MKMLKDELNRIERLAKKNAEKSKQERDAPISSKKPKHEKEIEKKMVDDVIDARDAHRLFKEMKERDF